MKSEKAVNGTTKAKNKTKTDGNRLNKRAKRFAVQIPVEKSKGKHESRFWQGFDGGKQKECRSACKARKKR